MYKFVKYNSANNAIVKYNIRMVVTEWSFTTAFRQV